MKPYAAHAVTGRLVFETWIEGLALWRRLAVAVPDPLAWPLSTHRDLVGHSFRPVARRRRNPHDVHRYVQSDAALLVRRVVGDWRFPAIVDDDGPRGRWRTR